MSSVLLGNYTILFVIYRVCVRSGLFPSSVSFFSSFRTKSSGESGRSRSIREEPTVICIGVCIHFPSLVTALASDPGLALRAATVTHCEAAGL